MPNETMRLTGDAIGTRRVRELTGMSLRTAWNEKSLLESAGGGRGFGFVNSD